MYRTLIIAATLIGMAGVAHAQDESAVSVNMGGGFTIPQSDLKDTFGTGGNFQFGVNFRVHPMLKIQAEYFYNRLGSKDLTPGGATTLPAALVTSIPLTANHTMHDGDFNLIIGPSTKSMMAAPYGILGAGVYHRTVNLTTPAVGLATVCDPWLYICYPTPVSVDQIVGERSSTEFGYNLGAGISVKMTDTAKFYAEFRYIHTNGPSITNPSTGVSTNANGSYFPITFGIRFHGE
jgi:opacity protein-like surface antigen